MNMIPVGIAGDDRYHFSANAADYSNSHFDGIQVRKTEKGKPAIIMHSKTPAPMMWKVCYAFSEIFFHSKEEAEAFCDSHGMTVLKEQTK